MRKRKANLGSGTDYLPGWINVDIEPSYKKDVVADLQKPFPFKDNSLDEIKASDILEHFTKEDGEKFLGECQRCLKVGGKIFIRTHNVEQIFKQFRHDPQVMIHFLYGNTAETGIFGAHKFAYTKEYATHILKKIGFTVLSISEETTNFLIKAKKVKPTAAKKLKIGLFFDRPISQQKQQLVQFLSVDLKQRKNQVAFFSDLRKKELYQQKFDVLILNGKINKVLMTIWAYLRHTPVVWIQGQDDPINILPITFLSKAIYRILGKLPIKVIIPSKATAQEFMMHTRISLSKIRIIEYSEIFLKGSKKNQQSKIADQFFAEINDHLISD